MFDDQQKESVEVSGTPSDNRGMGQPVSKTDIADIFADTESDVLTSKAGGKENEYRLSAPKDRSWILRAFLFFVVLGILGTGAYFAWKWWKSLSIPTTPSQVQNSNAPTQSAPFLDADLDGLSDDEEARLGTNSKMVDTDSDGLSDYEEVKVWKTDPLDADTDGDTFLDGQEVKNGYDPKGPGKITDVKKVL